MLFPFFHTLIPKDTDVKLSILASKHNKEDIFWWLNVSVILFYHNRDASCFLNIGNAGGILFQQVFLSLSSPSSCKVQHRLWHIDPPLSRGASGFNTATSRHINSSTGYASYLLCPKVTAISPLWTTESGWQPSWDEDQHPQRAGWPSAGLSLSHEEELSSLSVSVIGIHLKAARHTGAQYRTGVNQSVCASARLHARWVGRRLEFIEWRRAFTKDGIHPHWTLRQLCRQRHQCGKITPPSSSRMVNLVLMLMLGGMVSSLISSETMQRSSG